MIPLLRTALIDIFVGSHINGWYLCYAHRVIPLPHTPNVWYLCYAQLSCHTFSTHTHQRMIPFATHSIWTLFGYVYQKVIPEILAFKSVTGTIQLNPIPTLHIKCSQSRIIYLLHLQMVIPLVCTSNGWYLLTHINWWYLCTSHTNMWYLFYPITGIAFATHPRMAIHLLRNPTGDFFATDTNRRHLCYAHSQVILLATHINVDIFATQTQRMIPLRRTPKGDTFASRPTGYTFATHCNG